MSPDPVTGVADALTMLLTVVNKTMDILPNYEQKKKEKYYRLRKRYEHEKSKHTPDDNLCDYYRDSLLRYIQTFTEEISG
jgi:hypothetical protein